MATLHVHPIFAAVMMLLPLSANAWEQDQSQNAVAKAQAHQSQHQVQAQHQSQTQRSSQRLVNAPQTNVTVSAPAASAVPSGGSVTNFTAPSWMLPSIGASGNDCPTVGISGGGSGPFGGGGIGPSWLSTDCNTRKLAEQLQQFGYPDQALILLRNHFPEVDEAFKTAAKEVSSQPPAKPVAASLSGVDGADSFCYGYSSWTGAERGRYRSRCGK